MTQIKLRRDTSANFTSKNPVLGVGEPAYETDTKKLKIGDGTTAYTQLEYFSSGGGGSTNISATLPLKIVDGVISLEVDGQTIQIVDGKLHANLDELGNEVNTLAGDVAGVQADLLKKQDGLVSASPIEIKKSTGLTVVGTPMSGNDFVMDSMSTTSYCTFPENYLAIGNEYQFKFTTPSSWPSDYSSVFDFGDPLGPQYDYPTGNISVWTNREGAEFEPVIPSPTLNTTYYIRMKMVTSTRVETCYSTDGKTFTEWKATDINASLPWAAQQHHVGVGYDPRTNEIVRAWTGTIDLKECYVIANGVKYYMFPDAKTGAIGINLGSGLAITDGKLTATGSSAPTNMVTTDTAQTITGSKTFKSELKTYNPFVFDCREGNARFDAVYLEKGSGTITTSSVINFDLDKFTNDIILGIDNTSLLLRGDVKNNNNKKFLTQSTVTAGNNITVTETTDGIQVAGLSNAAIANLSGMTNNMTTYPNVVSGTEYTTTEAGFWIAQGETMGEGYITIDIKDKQGNWVSIAGINGPGANYYLIPAAPFVAAGETIRVRHGNVKAVYLSFAKPKGGVQ